MADCAHVYARTKAGWECLLCTSKPTPQEIQDQQDRRLEEQEEITWKPHTR